jgi:purine-binding chemotaxis protein CheW
MPSELLTETPPPRVTGPQDDTARTFLTFDLCGQTFGVQVANVREILDRQPVTRLPDGPADMIGVIDVRGASIPVIDVTRRLHLDAMDEGPDTRIVVFERADGRACAVVSGKVREVCYIDRREVEEPPERDPRSVVTGLFRRAGALVVLLNADRLLHGGGGDR